jgi:hypothetical protein
MVAREPNLTVDIEFGLNRHNERSGSITKYEDNLTERLRKSYQLASEAISKSQERQKDNYDLKSRGVVLEVADRILLRVVAFDGRHKLAEKWEEDPYLVISQPNKDIPVYKVQREDGVGRVRILHINLLKPI